MDESERFHIETGYYEAEDRPLIYDNGSGVDDDYYFCGDFPDFKCLCELLNELDSKNKKLFKENLDLAEDNDYYRSKSASLETGYIELQRANDGLIKEVEKQFQIIRWLFNALKDSANILKENKVDYITNDLLDELISGKINLIDLINKWEEE